MDLARWQRWTRIPHGQYTIGRFGKEKLFGNNEKTVENAHCDFWTFDEESFKNRWTSVCLWSDWMNQSLVFYEYWSYQRKKFITCERFDKWIFNERYFKFSRMSFPSKKKSFMNDLELHSLWFKRSRTIKKQRIALTNDLLKKKWIVHEQKWKIFLWIIVRERFTWWITYKKTDSNFQCSWTIHLKTTRAGM